MKDNSQIFAELAAMTPGRVVLPEDDRYEATRNSWSRTDTKPAAIVLCREVSDVQAAVKVARERELPLSVRGGGHDWVGRALCSGIVVDLRAMRTVEIENAVDTSSDTARAELATPSSLSASVVERFGAAAAMHPSSNGLHRALTGSTMSRSEEIVASKPASARVGGGALASDVAAAAAPLGLAPALGQIGAVGVAGLTLGGGYGPLIARYGLASDNLIEAQVVLADGRVVIAGEDRDADLLWALRGGGGNFGVVTNLTIRLHRIPSAFTGILLYAQADAVGVLSGVAELCGGAPDELTMQIALIAAPGGEPMVGLVPTWIGDPEEDERWAARFVNLAKPASCDLSRRSFSDALAMFDGPMTQPHRVLMANRWFDALTSDVAAILAACNATRPSLGCSIVTHEFRGAATLRPANVSAFAMREPHMMVEIIAQFDDGDGRAEAAWIDGACASLNGLSLPGAYPNLLTRDDPRVAAAHGANRVRLAELKQRYDPHDLFRSALGL